MKWARRVKKYLKEHKQTSLIVCSMIVVGLVATFVYALPKNLEAESGIVSGEAGSIADTSASSGNAVKFGASQPTSASSITQYGITWTFSQSRPVGQFANGDYWVQGPVIVTSITPDFASGQNGWQVNPTSGTAHGLDSRLSGYQSNLVPSLPYTATAGQSIIKAISTQGSCASSPAHTPCLLTAAVLTVLGSVPANNGATVFRPPFFGTDKPQFTTAQLRTDLLPSLAPVASAPSLASVERRYQRMQIDYRSSYTGRYMHASENFIWQDGQADVAEYGAEIAADNNQAVLRLFLNDPLSIKMPALVRVVQTGIDVYGMHNGGVTWLPNGGHMGGRKVMAVFAAVLLDDATMKSEIANAPYGTYGDDGHLYVTTNPTTVAAMNSAGYAPVLWGWNCGNGEYEDNQNGDSGSRDCRDPIGMIDGGEIPGGTYQSCCTSQPMKGSSLAVRLLPGAKTVWNYQPLHDYADRWVTFGAWTQPDNWNSLGRTPVRDYAARHGISPNGGSYGSTFANNMWTAYRSIAE